MRYGTYRCDEGEYIEAVLDKHNISPIYFQADEIDYKDEYSMDFNYQLNPHWPIFTTFTQDIPFVFKNKLYIWTLKSQSFAIFDFNHLIVNN